MADHNFSQDDLNNLIEDVNYLKDEAEAMQYVIESVPYDRSPPEGRSIAEMLVLIDHAQLSYYRPIIERTVNDDKAVNLDEVSGFRESFEYDEESEVDIQKILKKLAKHRAGLVNVIEGISLIDWDTIIYNANQEIYLYQFVRQMLRFERNILNEIADQIMTIKKDQKQKRKIENRRKQRENKQDFNNS